MRMFVYEPGEPGQRGSIRAEFFVPEAEVDAIDGGTWAPSHSDQGEIVTREQLLAVSTRRSALLAWEAGDDRTAEADHLTFKRNIVEDAVRRNALDGCVDAGRILARGFDLAEAEGHLDAHSCSRSPQCGGRAPLELVR